MAEEIARLTTVWDANFQKLDEKLNKVIRSHHAAASRIKKDSDTFTRQLEERYGRVGKAMGNVFNDSRLATIQAGAGHLRVFGSALEPLGVAGLTAAAGIAALAVAGQQARAAMQFADEIDDAAQKLMIGTGALQEFRFAMTQVGGEAKDADSAIESFNKTLGSAQSGLSPKAMKGFAALGFTNEQIQSFNSGEDALEEVAKRIADLSKESEQAAVAEKLGLSAMLPLLREGAAEMEALRQKARDLGIVMDAELVAKGAEANQQFETMASVIKVQLTSAFVELSDEVVSFTGFIADALTGLNAFLGKFEEWRVKVNAMYGDDFVEEVRGGNPGQALMSAGRSFLSGRTTSAAQAIRDGLDLSAPAPTLADMQALARPPVRAGGDGRLTPSPARGGGRGRDTAEQRRRREEQFEKQLDRVQMELLRAYDTVIVSIGAEAGNRIALLNAEHEANLREIAAAEEEYIRSSGLRGLAKTEADQLREKQEALAVANRQAIEVQERLDLEDYRLKVEEDAAQAALDLLGIEQDLAITVRDRHEVAKRILAAQLKMERDQQKAELAADPNIDDEERARRLAEGDRGRQAEYGAHDRESDGAQMARDVVSDIRGPEDRLEALAEMYEEIDRLRQEDVISEAEAARAKAETDVMYREERLARSKTMLDTLAGLQNSSNKKLAAIGKAAAMTQATIDGVLAVQKALASAPPPFNYVQAAIVGAVAAANVAAIAGMADGGLVTGPGGPRQDNQLRRLSSGEFVVNAKATSQNRALLEALNTGRLPGLADGGMVGRLNAATASVPTRAGATAGSSLTFAPQVDARGADMAAVRRLEQVLDEQSQSFAERVNGVRDRRQKYRLGGRRT